ncbi:PhoH family protein [Salinicoccus roseus]|jgi:phosphate starvation-inducible PhoH-like protein|uniref:PhoH-like protein n=1 Tax=Salinicoccus roseus TaxID=45670 RepID=A0A265E979_9STAP|nr:PhoH family protein [Salinicoccus roseus]OZT78144.1 phosphate starvation-inducible protein PhoH [Salinicoccus roseus]RPE54215.1 phosphate starvation-inducible PhoH-like protein [Salinicoccus roseus]GGA67315.1 phosphate starvation protein PhoH [Salinicoccus roseus]
MPNIINIDSLDEAQALIGANDQHITFLEEEFDVTIHTLGNEITVDGADDQNVELTEDVLINLLKIIQRGMSINLRDVQSAAMMARKGTIEYLADLYNEEIARDVKGKSIRAKTTGQRLYIENIKRHDLTFGIGPAGTGKTFLAVVLACQMLRENSVKRIVLTRPAVEAGENLGFLPGDLKEKVDPYLRPLYDGLHTVLGAEQTDRLIERGVIEVAPLAYMRGRTLNEAFVILDEAQNTTEMQMKMFLTRLGFGSKMVVTGDETQIDLPGSTKSGLVESVRLLSDVRGIAVNKMDESDVVRHPLVSKIIKAYEKE